MYPGEKKRTTTVIWKNGWDPIHCPSEFVTTYSNEINHVKKKIVQMIRFLSKLVDNEKNMVDIAKISMNFHFSRIHEIFLNKYLRVNSAVNLRAISKFNFFSAPG